MVAEASDLGNHRGGGASFMPAATAISTSKLSDLTCRDRCRCQLQPLLCCVQQSGASPRTAGKLLQSRHTSLVPYMAEPRWFLGMCQNMLM